MDKLLPCPFCGGEAFVATVEHPPENRPNGYRFHGQIMCRNCQASAGTTGFDLTHEEATRKAISAWNRRTDHIRDTTKKVSNADRIRSMSDEELAKELTRNPAIPCRMCEHHDDELNICRAWASDFTCVVAYAEALTLDWLQQPAETEGTE